MLVLSKDQEMIPPVYVIDAHAQKFHIFQLLLLILKAFAQCTPSLHATALTSCIVLCAAAERSVASTNSSATYCQQLPAPHQTRLPPPLSPRLSWFVRCACVPHYTASHRRIPSSECLHLDTTIPSTIQNTKYHDA